MHSHLALLMLFTFNWQILIIGPMFVVCKLSVFVSGIINNQEILRELVAKFVLAYLALSIRVHVQLSVTDASQFAPRLEKRNRKLTRNQKSGCTVCETSTKLKIICDSIENHKPQNISIQFVFIFYNGLISCFFLYDCQIIYSFQVILKVSRVSIPQIN